MDTCAVVTSAVPELPPGSQIPKRDIAECLFPTLAPPGKTRYYLGKRFWTASEADFRGKELTLPMEQGPLRLPLHPCRAARSGPDSGVFSAFEAEGIPIIRSSRFWEGEEVYSESLARQFEKLGQNLRDKPSMIWDIHDNHGGDSDYPQHFLRGLNGNAQWPIHCAVLSSPAVLLAKGRHAGEGDKRFWTFYPSAPRQRDGGTYPGTMYLLTSEEVGSSAEAAVSMAMNLPNCVRIGESTGGRGVFGEVLHYELPHSRLVCCVPHKLYLSGAEEGIGYAPHFWLDTPDLCCETLRWLRNPETYQAPIAASARNPESV